MNTFGKIIKTTIYGSSHEKYIGLIMDGLPAGIKIDFKEIEKDLSQRRPGEIGTTKRIEPDKYEVISGIYEGRTTGAPLNIMIENRDVRSKDYKNLVEHPRPGHADFTAHIKYKGFNDPRGGGNFSGRLTAPLVIAGSIAKMLIPMKVNSKIIQIGKIKDESKFNDYLKNIAEKKDSAGGIVKIEVSNMPVGLGSPLFDKLDARLSYMLMNVPGVKGIRFGSAYQELYGSEYNDLILNVSGETKTNNSGGINGGISNGNNIEFDVYVKPTSSIGIEQETYNLKSKKVENLKIEGRHDVAFVRRIPIVLESVTALVLLDFYMLNKIYE